MTDQEFKDLFNRHAQEIVDDVCRSIAKEAQRARAAEEALRAALADAVNALECAPDRNKPMWQAIRTGRAALGIK